MVDKVKALNWKLFSKFFVIFSYVSIIYSIVHLSMNTKRLENSTVIMYYFIIGLILAILMKLTNERNTEFK